MEEVAPRVPPAPWKRLHTAAPREKVAGVGAALGTSRPCHDLSTVAERDALGRDAGVTRFFSGTGGGTSSGKEGVGGHRCHDRWHSEGTGGIAGVK